MPPHVWAADKLLMQKVEIRILERLESEFRAARSRIRPEFLTGDETADSVGLIQVIAEVKK